MKCHTPEEAAGKSHHLNSASLLTRLPTHPPTHSPAITLTCDHANQFTRSPAIITLTRHHATTLTCDHANPLTRHHAITLTCDPTHSPAITPSGSHVITLTHSPAITPLPSTEHEEGNKGKKTNTSIKQNEQTNETIINYI